MDPLARLELTPKLLLDIASLDEFKGQWKALGGLAPDRLNALRRVATIESVGSSTRIEGVQLSDGEIERLLSGLDTTSFRSRDEQEVAGYADLMTLIFDSWADIALSENHIKQLHEVLLRHSDKDERHRGHYKKVPNHVEAFDDRGHSLGIVFATATPFETPEKMRALVSWAEVLLESRGAHPVLIIAAFVVRFLAIHPFQDGNGRLSRALTTLLLLRAGYTYVPYSSLERVIEDNKDAYYRSLRRAQATLDVDEARLGDWIEFFVRMLLRQKDALQAQIDREHLIAPIDTLSRQIMDLARQRGRVAVRDAVAVTKAPRPTVKRHLRILVDANLLAARGQGRGSYYVCKPEPERPKNPLAEPGG
jgi:Fic family protein